MAAAAVTEVVEGVAAAAGEVSLVAVADSEVAVVEALAEAAEAVLAVIVRVASLEVGMEEIAMKATREVAISVMTDSEQLEGGSEGPNRSKTETKRQNGYDERRTTTLHKVLQSTTKH